MICYYYPPLLDVGCRRSVAFSKFMKNHGWQPFVLSVKNPDKTFCQLGQEPPPANIPVVYTRSLFNTYWMFGKINGMLSRLLSFFDIHLKRNYLHDIFSVPDIFVGWIPGAVFSGYRLIKKNQIDCIYVSCSPFSSAIAGIVLKKLTRKILIVDFRDPFSVNIPDNFGVPHFRKKNNCFSRSFYREYRGSTQRLYC
jgi:hypothetical protein